MNNNKIRKKSFDPDMVILNGKILTMDGQFNRAEAVAVKDGKIVAVGKNPEIQNTIGPETQVLDLQGKTMLPGIFDHHIHCLLWALLFQPPLALELSLPGVRSLDDLISRIQEKVKAGIPGEGIYGFDLDTNHWTEVKDNHKTLTKRDLDAVSPGNPVCIHGHQRNQIWANSRALESAHITRDAPDPQGCRVERDPATGEPTGFIEAGEFMDYFIIGSLLPPLTIDQRRAGILACIKALNAYGITSFIEPGVGPDFEYFCRGVHNNINIKVYNDLKKEGQLNARVSILVFSQNPLQPGEITSEKLKTYLNYVGTNTGFGDEWVRIAGQKIMADFVHFNKTAWMYEEFVGGGNGALLMAGNIDEERCCELQKMIALAHKQRWQWGIHVIGDRATDAVVEAYIKALQDDPWDARHYVIHANFVRPETAKRMAEYNIGASIQSVWKWSYMFSELEEGVVGPERDAYSFPMRTLLDAGVRVANGSDAPETEPDWRRGVEAAVTRISKLTGKVSGPKQRVTREEALRSFTIDAAYVDHQDHIKGSIEPGKLADFCILGQDILTVEAERIHEIPILMTIVDGRIVYDAGSDEIRRM